MLQESHSCEMPLGIPFLDASHHVLLEQLEQLALADDREFCHCYCALVDRIEHDFYTEEQWMEKIDFSGLQNHLEQHSRVLGAMHHARPRVMEGDIALGREFSRLLPQWLMLHIATMDSVLATALQVAGLGSANGSSGESRVTRRPGHV